MEPKESNSNQEESPRFSVNDRRHWALEPDELEESDASSERLPTYVEQLKKEAEEKDRKLKEYIAAYKNKNAENDEFRIRLQKQNELQLDRMKARFIKQLLPILDNLQRALDSAKQNNDPASLQQGIELILAQFHGELESSGVEKFTAQGRPFDPKTDEVLLTETTDDPDRDNWVLEDLEPGFRFKEHLIRPAKVKVAKLTSQ